MPDAIFFVICFKGKDPIFTPNEVVNLCYDVRTYICNKVTFSFDVHQ